MWKRAGSRKVAGVAGGWFPREKSRGRACVTGFGSDEPVELRLTARGGVRLGSDRSPVEASPLDSVPALTLASVTVFEVFEQASSCFLSQGPGVPAPPHGFPIRGGLAQLVRAA